MARHASSRYPLLALLGLFSLAAVDWPADIQFLVKTLSARGMTIDAARGPSTRGQKDFAKLYPPETYQPAINALTANIPNLSDAEVVLEIMRIHSTAKVAHNTVGLPGQFGFENRLPLTFRWYADGLAIISAAPEYRDLLGSRVVKFGNKPTEEVLTAVAPFIPWENEVWLKQSSVRFFTLQPLLQHLQLLDPQTGRLLLTVRKPGAEEDHQATVAFAPYDAQQQGLRSVLQATLPVYATGPPDRFYWSRYLEQQATLYIQYSRCANDKNFPMRDFVQQVRGDLDTRKVERVVIDLRFNGGGDSRVINPLQDLLLSRPSLRGRLFVLIGPSTYSSAILNAISLRQRGARLIGEPTGGKPGGYGEVKEIILPGSQLKVRYTSKFFTAPKELDSDSLTPEIPAPATLAATLAGQDPALDAAISSKVAQPPPHR